MISSERDGVWKTCPGRSVQSSAFFPVTEKHKPEQVPSTIHGLPGIPKPLILLSQMLPFACFGLLLLLDSTY
jgi:hypothetical protein